ncbi:cellulose biosynthesis protein BcsG [Motilimonas pumila]|uniref:Cellulose biosynthesis protein BcsG n=1 Tax=Motilimonas pumila TaxID=2303987 RepID=A0A418YFS9_9GAMM|nr:cellulose biosynthesis protein BcsG [Motilimonas pumila]RJG48398.1 cellulose biosynthesis protein BcsG [Motilimonas pumila]
MALFQAHRAHIGWWNVFLLFKLVLAVQEVIGFDPLYNFAFVAFLLLPIPTRLGGIIKQALALVLAALLLHHDSFLPPLDRLWQQTDQLMQFDWRYLLELASSFVSVPALVLIATLAVFYAYTHQFIRVSSFVLVAMLYLSWPESPKEHSVSQPQTAAGEIASSGQTQAQPQTAAVDTSDEGLNQYRSDFFAQEQSKVSSISSLSLDSKPNFDILLLNVCSLSWDDLAFTKQSQHPLFSEFDIVFKEFNAATSYSGPAVLRLLRASCGQQPHADLFSPVSSKQCLLFEQLTRLGFQQELMLNHNGEFDAFTSHIQQNMGNISPLVDIKQLTPYQYAFDGSPIYRDKDVLNAWLDKKDNTASAALYNTISIHDGNKVVGNNKLNRIETYRQQQKVLLDDLYAFFQQLQQSERNIVVVLIPEHGGGVRGDKMQISGMREIPTFAITHVPVGVKFFGPDVAVTGGPVTIDAPSSYLALSDLLANIISEPVYSQPGVSMESLTQALDHSEVVSENSGTTMLKVIGNQYYTFDNDKWTLYKP